MKTQLLANRPIVTSFRIYANTNTAIKAGFLPVPKPPVKTGHAVVVIGWDREGWIILNSYNKNWGKWKNGTFKAGFDKTNLLESLFVLFPATTITPINNIFKDVTTASPHADAIQFVKEKGLMKGTDSGRFEPDRPLTRREAAIIFKRFYDALQ
jgi:hypothetical protein